jgi:malonate decarboxylase epsilon subunit
LLQPVAEALKKSLQAIHLQEPKMVYAGNVTGRALRSAEAISKDLATNIAHGVRWYDATTVLRELGCHLFLEMPPGHTLSELAQQNLSGVSSIPVEARVLPRVLRLAQQEEAKN